jgi:hypothetical protein
MEAFAAIVHLWLRVITLADITDVIGKFIPSNILGGEWQAG